MTDDSTRQKASTLLRLHQDPTLLTVVNVWAWWCQPCRAELPVVEEFARAHPEYTVVGVHADGNAANGASLLNELGVGLPSYQDDAGVFAAAQGLPPVVPVTVVLRGGDVRMHRPGVRPRHVGQVTEDAVEIHLARPHQPVGEGVQPEVGVGGGVGGGIGIDADIDDRARHAAADRA